MTTNLWLRIRRSDLLLKFVSGCVVLLSSWMLVQLFVDGHQAQSPKVAEIVYEGRLGALEQQIKELRKAIDSKPVIVNPANVPEIVQSLGAKLDELNGRLSKLEAAIESSPEKALSIPLMRKDIDDERSHVVAVRAEIAQIYDFSKWFLGLIGLMASTMFIGSFRRNAKNSSVD